MVTTQQRWLSVYDEACSDDECIGTVKESYSKIEPDPFQYHGSLLELYLWDTYG